MATKIEAADAATDRISTLVYSARQALDAFGGRVFNGYGVFHDPSLLRGRLATAIAQLSEAKERFDATDWPTRDDYEAEEG